MSPGSSTAPTAPGPLASRPTSSTSGSAHAAAQADEVLVLGRRLLWDPRGPVEFYPQYKASIGEPMRVSWSMDIEDPDEPARLVNRLEGTALGCAWLLDRWNELGDLLVDGLRWQAPDRFKATRLLGKQPLDPINDLQVRWIHLCVSAMDPECTHEFGDVSTELDSAEWKRFIERLKARDAWRGKPDDAETGKAALLELVSEQEERLETLLAAHLERESAADPDALGFQDTQEGERLRRYQMACNRTLLRILETLRKRHREADKAKEGGKRVRKSSRVESPSEADLLRETFGPLVAEGLEPGVGAVGEGEPSSGAEVPLETSGRVNGRGQETRAQQSEVVPYHEIAGLAARVSRPPPARPKVSRSTRTRRTKPPPPLFGRGSLDRAPSPEVGRGSPDPALSPTAGLPIHQDATNEATAPPHMGHGSPAPEPGRRSCSGPHGPRTTDHGPRTKDERSQQPHPGRPPTVAIPAGDRAGTARPTLRRRPHHRLLDLDGCSQSANFLAESCRRVFHVHRTRMGPISRVTNPRPIGIPYRAIGFPSARTRRRANVPAAPAVPHLLLVTCHLRA